MKKQFFSSILICILAINAQSGNYIELIKEKFPHPGNENKPWVYWYVMDGYFNKDGITADLEAMAKVGIGGAILLEVNLGGESGKTEFMSNEWRDCFQHAIKEATRLNIEITLGSGPGWAGSGGPWIKHNKPILQWFCLNISLK